MGPLLISVADGHGVCMIQEFYKLGPYFLLGDSGYACQANLLTPYPVEETEDKTL